MSDRPTTAEIGALGPGLCLTIYPCPGAEIFVAAPYSSHEPYTVMLVIYEASPNGPARLAAADPRSALVRMLQLAVDCTGGRLVLSVTLVGMMSAVGDVASEEMGAGAIIVQREDGHWRVGCRRSSQMTDDERTASRTAGDPHEVMAIVEEMERTWTSPKP